MEIKWIKVCTNIFDDEKMYLIESMPDADGIVVCWFKLLCLAGKQNNNGVFLLNDKIAYTEEMLATIFRRPLPLVRLAMEVFKRFGMIEVVEGTITIPNWEKHQNADRLNELREYNRLAQQRSREKRKMLSVIDKSLTSQRCQDIDKEEERDLDIIKEKEKSDKKEKKTASRFHAPTLEEIQAYCDERNNGIDAERFLDYYTANGWVQGKGKPIKDWKATVRTWECADMPKQPIRQELNDYAELG